MHTYFDTATHEKPFLIYDASIGGKFAALRPFFLGDIEVLDRVIPSEGRYAFVEFMTGAALKSDHLRFIIGITVELTRRRESKHSSAFILHPCSSTLPPLASNDLLGGVAFSI